MFKYPKSEALSCVCFAKHAKIINYMRAQVTHRIIFQLQHNFSSGLLIHLLITEVAGIRKGKELVILSQLPLFRFFLPFLFFLIFIFFLDKRTRKIPAASQERKKESFLTHCLLNTFIEVYIYFASAYLMNFSWNNGARVIVTVAPDAIHHHVKTCRANMKNMHFVAPEYGSKYYHMMFVITR